MAALAAVREAEFQPSDGDRRRRSPRWLRKLDERFVALGVVHLPSSDEGSGSLIDERS